MQTDAATPTTTATERCIAFAVAPDLPAFCLAPATLAEVVFEPIECPLPGAPAALRRIVALRGALLPLFDLAAWLGLPPPALPRVLAIGRGERAAAVLADGEPRVVEVRDDPGGAPPPPAIARFVRPGRDAAGTPLWRFDHEAWFAIAATPTGSQPQAASPAAETTP